jgi:putative transposase
MLNLPPPPPNFRGLDPDEKVHVYRRHMPHWRQPGATYFVTFRLADSLPQEKLDEIKRMRQEWERTHLPPRSEGAWEDHCRDVIRRTEAWFDEGYGSCIFRHEASANAMEEALHHFQNDRYFLSCYVIMPNHAHMILRPLGDWDLEYLLQGLKGVVARSVNQLRDERGTIWQEEFYDRIVRDSEHLWRIVQYVGSNPRRAGLTPSESRRWIHPEWTDAGWGFVDS